MNRWGLYLSVVALTLFAIGVGGLNFLYRWQVKPGLDSQIQTQRQYKDAYVADREFLAKNANDLSLGGSTGSSDAGPFLNAHVLWTPGVSSKVALVNEATRIELLRVGSDWPIQIAKGRHPKIDLSFFKELPKFDYWDIERGSPIETLAAKAQFVPPTRLPLPDPGDLTSAAKLRLIAGGLDGDFVPALTDVRTLGRLLLSTENLQLVLTGLLLIDFERRAYNYYVENLHMDHNRWAPIEADVTLRARRSVLATRSYLRLWTPPAMLKDVFFAPTSPPGVCAALNEGIPFDYSLRSTLEPHFPFEMDTRAEYKMLDEIIAGAQKNVAFII